MDELDEFIIEAQQQLDEDGMVATDTFLRAIENGIDPGLIIEGLDFYPIYLLEHSEEAA